MSAHADFPPSAFARLMDCSGSWALERTVSRLPTTMHSAYGTAGHNISANVLATGLNACDFIGSEQEVEGFKFIVDKEMTAFIQIYVDAIQEEITGDGQLHIECLVDFSKTLGVTQTAFGTADAIIRKPKRLIIKDLKFGKGVLVYAKDNPQLALYALGALEKFGRDGIDQIAMYIHQPRRKHTSQWIISLDELDDFAQQAKAAIAKALQPNASLTPGKKQCQFCNAKPICPAVNKAATVEFDLLPNPREINQHK